MVKTISILGCGWLGTALGKRFLTKGVAVKGSAASADSYNQLETTGIQTYHIKIDPDTVMVDYKNFFNTDVLIIALPPRGENVVENFPKQISQIVQLIDETKIGRVLFVSSTSVYQPWNGVVREGDEGYPSKANGRALLKAEKLLQALPGVKTTVVRLGGLIGYDRNPARFVAGKTDVVADTPVNLIHRDDAVHIISALIEKEIWGEVFNACSPQHPTKREFYSKAAAISGLPAPVFSSAQENYKIVNSDKLVTRLGYTFKYISPMDYLKEVEEWAYRI
jgi:nucleoside-diphosphate-sugar epimerase